MGCGTLQSFLSNFTAVQKYVTDILRKHNYKGSFIKKVNQSRYRPGVAQRVPGS